MHNTQENSFTQTRHAGCKVNLCLSITGVREDGYHTLDSIFWPLSAPYDTLIFSAQKSASMSLSMSCQLKDINTKNNTLTKAFDAFQKAGGVLQEDFAKVHVQLIKNIPHGAGLGGGSSDAANVLLWCNEHAQKPLSTQVLHEAALSVGADVPFFLYNKPARVQGIGEILQILPTMPPLGYALVICPNVYISTPWAYKKIDEEKNTSFSKKLLTKSPLDYRTLFTGAGHENTQREGRDAGHRTGGDHRGEIQELLELYQEVGNDFESVIFTAHPELAQLKQELLDNGALLTSMSGSGSSIVGIFSTQAEAKRLAEKFSRTQCRVFIAPL